MVTLRLTHAAQGDDRHTVHVALEGDGLVRQTVDTGFSFALSPGDAGDLRWYLEDYLKWPHDPAPKIAARVQARMEAIGTELFRAVFQANDDARDLWATLRTRLGDTRVEVVTGVDEATTIPWELLRDPKTGDALALRCHEFVRAQPDAVQPPVLPASTSGAIRILLVICRPGGGDDVSFRSVAVQLVKSLGDAARKAFDLDVLRPPTFEALSRSLREAHAEGRPYHLVHFDGHGVYFDLAPIFDAWQKQGEEGRQQLARVLLFDPRTFSPQVLYPHVPRPGAHGFLVFENAGSGDNQRWVDGQELGRLLVATGVSVLVLNACRSAHATIQEKPEGADDADAHQQRRAWGSLAQEIMDAGVAGLVAMRYNVFVVTAAQFVAELYASLVRGRTLGQAVTLGRKRLHAQPLRTVAFAARALQDWPVPIVYEAAPIALFPVPGDDSQPGDDSPLGMALASPLDEPLKEGAITPVSGLDPTLPPTPDAGFVGRDETLLALDRAFDHQRIVLLHAYAGSGKTATAAEFARWYALTGGVNGPVLFTSFEQHRPLARVLDRVGEVFGPMLERSGVHWLAITDHDERRRVALEVLKQVPVLWIWDNVEPVKGFPAGTDSLWSDAEQAELVAFLRDCRDTQAKILLTSRRDEESWLGDLPARIQVPPMPITDRLLLARALAEKRGRRDEVIKDWRPLLEFSAGNPLTLTVLVGQALRDRLVGHQAVQAFVDRLRAGEVAFDDEAGEGRSRSLAVSLGYGFEHAFDDRERRCLAVLHLFQGFVEVDALLVMGDTEMPWCLPSVRGLSRDDAITVLDRAAEIGLLTGQGGGYYTIHPAVPWFFRGHFERDYADTEEAAPWAFVEAMGALGNHYSGEYDNGNRDVVRVLRAEEANLIQARRLARANGWWHALISAMQGLGTLYGHTGERAAWRKWVHEIVPDFVDPESEGPLPGRENEWSVVTEYRVLLAREEREWDEAERLQRISVDWDRRHAAPLLELPPSLLDHSQRNTIRTLAASWHDLGEIRRELQQEDCIAAYEESMALAESIKDRAGLAACAANLGTVHMNIAMLRDLDQAEHWYRRSLELTDERDGMGRGGCHTQLGTVAFERFKDARAQERPKEKVLEHLNDSVHAYQQALEHFPADAIGELGVVHHQLGMIYASAGEPERAVTHFSDSIRYEEIAGNAFGAAQTRLNVALVHVQAERPQDALVYARAALAGFRTFGESAVEKIEQTRRLIEEIEQEQ